jgi:hypothetical protein
MSNNPPSHIFSRPERCANIILSFDAFSDAQTGFATHRIQKFADDYQLDLEHQTALLDPPLPCFHANADGRKEVESKFINH